MALCPALGVVALLLASSASARPLPARAPAAQTLPDGSAPQTAPVASPVAARAGGDMVTFAELDTLMLERHGAAPRGKEIATYLAQRALITDLAKDAGLRVTDAELDARVLELDSEMKRAGVEDGIAGELARGGIERGEFRATLRLAILHERLTRRALGLPADAQVSGDQQQIWIDSEVERRGLQMATPPFEDGVAARLGAIEIQAAPLAELIRETLEESEIRDALTQLLLLRRVEARLAAAQVSISEDAVTAEIERRRAEAESDPRYQGVPFENLLAAQGLSTAGLARDPAVRIAALSTRWVETKHSDQALRDAYTSEQAFFENHFGAAVHVRAIFLGGSANPNELARRSATEAEQQLRALAEEIDSAQAFAVRAGSVSEDAEARLRAGEVGWLVRASRALPRDLIAEIHSAPEGLFGPHRLPTGAVLLWIGERRSSPSWEVMRSHVQRELRRRFLLECLPPAEILTYLDDNGVSTPASAPRAPTGG